MPKGGQTGLENKTVLHIAKVYAFRKMSKLNDEYLVESERHPPTIAPLPEPRIPTATCCIRIKSTGKFFIGFSGHGIQERYLHKNLKALMQKNKSFMAWDISNCAEIHAFHRLLTEVPDVTLNDLEAATVHTQTVNLMDPCSNCIFLFVKSGAAVTMNQH